MVDVSTTRIDRSRTDRPQKALSTTYMLSDNSVPTPITSSRPGTKLSASRNMIMSKIILVKK